MRARATACLRVVVVCAVLPATVGCEKIREISPNLAGTVVVPGGGSSQRGNVIPTRQPPRRFVIAIEDERSLTYIARELGVTVENIIATNELQSTVLKPGQQLHIDASPADVSRYLANREARKARKAARAKKKAEEKAARKADKMKRAVSRTKVKKLKRHKDRRHNKRHRARRAR